MSLLDKVGKLAMDGLDKASRVADRVQERVDPLIDRSPLATKVRDRIAPKAEREDIPDPFDNDSPFVEPEPEVEEAEQPLGNPNIPAQVYGRGTDPWTGRTLQLLTDHDTEHEFVDLESEGGLKIETRLVRETGQDTDPYVFIRGELVGGFNALNEIVRLGQLDEMTKPPEERSSGAGGIRIVIPKREGDEKPPGEVG
jgi:glutaredoxin